MEKFVTLLGEIFIILVYFIELLLNCYLPQTGNQN